MTAFVSNFRWLMLVFGLLTCTMFLALFSPSSSIQSNFGETLTGPAMEIVVRNWGALIGISGLMLIYGAFVEPVRRFVLIVTGLSKTVFVTLVLTYGMQYMSFGAGTAVVADVIMVLLFIAYLLLSTRVPKP